MEPRCITRQPFVPRRGRSVSATRATLPKSRTWRCFFACWLRGATSGCCLNSWPVTGCTMTRHAACDSTRRNTRAAWNGRSRRSPRLTNAPDVLKELDQRLRELRYQRAMRRARTALQESDPVTARQEVRLALQQRRAGKPAVIYAVLLVAPGLLRHGQAAKLEGSRSHGRSGAAQEMSTGLGIWSMREQSSVLPYRLLAAAARDRRSTGEQALAAAFGARVADSVGRRVVSFDLMGMRATGGCGPGAVRRADTAQRSSVHRTGVRRRLVGRVRPAG